MTRADWHEVAVDYQRGVVWIVDEDRGNMSVTNDAEAVVAAVNALHSGYRIIYRDSMGGWGELHHNEGEFSGFGPCPPGLLPSPSH